MLQILDYLTFLRWIATVGKTFLTCTGIGVGAKALNPQTSALHQQNKALWSFRIVTVVTQDLLPKRGRGNRGHLARTAKGKLRNLLTTISISFVLTLTSTLGQILPNMNFGKALTMNNWLRVPSADYSANTQIRPRETFPDSSIRQGSSESHC